MTIAKPLLPVTLIICGFLFCSSAVCAPQNPTQENQNLTVQEWKEDIVAMQADMLRLHKNLYHTSTPQEIETAFQQLSSDLPSLNYDQVVVRLMQITALIRDGHSGVNIAMRDGITHVALRISRYPDGIFVRAAPAQYSQAVGARIVRIGGVPWDVAMRRIDTIVACDPGNDGERWAWQPELHLTDPMVLHGLGLAKTGHSVTYTLQRGGRQFDLTLSPVLNGTEYFRYAAPPDWLDARGVHGPQPIKHPWYNVIELAYVPDAKAEYLQFNSIDVPDGESMTAFAAHFAEFEREHPDAQRLVIDLRHNPGGDNTVLKPLLVAIIQSRLNHRGQLFVLIGATTFSAAENLTNRIELYTDPIFVGEPTSQNVNFYGDAATAILPHSHLEVAMAHLWWQDQDPRDTRTATFPEIAISPGTFSDYMQGKDDALEYAFHAPAPKSLADTIRDALIKGDDQTWSAYQSYISDPYHLYRSSEEKLLNSLGYSLLDEKNISAALVVFRLNVRAHPSSANTFDSLGEAYEAAHNSTAAQAAYQRSLELNPANEHARAALVRLAGPKNP